MVDCSDPIPNDCLINDEIKKKGFRNSWINGRQKVKCERERESESESESERKRESARAREKARERE